MVGYAVIAHDAAITDKDRQMLFTSSRDALLIPLMGLDGIERRSALPDVRGACCQHNSSITNEANLTGGENVGGTTAAPATPEAGSDDDDGGGDPDPEPERQTRTRKPRNTSPAGNLPAPSAAQSADALNQFDTRPAASFVRLPVVCSLYACSPATAWRWVKARKIPAPVKLSDRVTAWRVGDLRAALAQLAA